MPTYTCAGMEHGGKRAPIRMTSMWSHLQTANQLRQSQLPQYGLSHRFESFACCPCIANCQEVCVLQYMLNDTTWNVVKSLCCRLRCLFCCCFCYICTSCCVSWAKPMSITLWLEVGARWLVCKHCSEVCVDCKQHMLCCSSQCREIVSRAPGLFLILNRHRPAQLSLPRAALK